MRRWGEVVRFDEGSHRVRRENGTHSDGHHGDEPGPTNEMREQGWKREEGTFEHLGDSPVHLPCQPLSGRSPVDGGPQAPG